MPKKFEEFSLACRVKRGRCYDHNFERFLPIFGEKIGIFLKNHRCDHIFAKVAAVCAKNAKIFAKIFGENIFKITTSVPDSAAVYFV
jgi:hypothetical protein